jgi:hypothetical protein
MTVNYDNVILVGVSEEKEWALEKGWDEKNILFPEIRKIEGRRYKRMRITWCALVEIVDAGDWELLARMHSQSLLANVETTVGPIISPEEMIAKQEVAALQHIAEDIKIEWQEPETRG